MQLSGDLEFDIDSDELAVWLNYNSTQKVMEGLKRYIQPYKENILQGSTIDLSSIEKTALQTTNVTAFIAGVETILNLPDLLEPEEEEIEENDTEI